MTFVKPSLDFIKQVYQSRALIKTLAYKEIKNKWSESVGGFYWFFAHSVSLILIYWVVFSFAFKVQPIGRVSFFPYFLCGMIPWFFFSEVLRNSTSAIIENTYLIKKVNFPIEILPLVKLIPHLLTHFVLFIILLLALSLNQISFTFYSLQFLYYFLGLFLLSLTLSFFLSAFNIILKDTAEILNITLNILFWLTPIVWVKDMIPQQYQYILRLNPLYYIVEGYRDSLIYHKPLWATPYFNMYFWTIIVLLFFCAHFIFNRSKKEFADYL